MWLLYIMKLATIAKPKNMPEARDHGNTAIEHG
jgi:hypothetical protein